MSFGEALERGWKEDLLRRYHQGPEGWRVSSTFGRKVQCLHPEWTSEDLLTRIREDPLLQLALTPEPAMAELFPRVQQAHIEGWAGVRLERLPKAGKDSVALSMDGSILVGWRDYCSTRPLDYMLPSTCGPKTYVFVFDARMDASLTERDLTKFLSCASRTLAVTPTQVQFVVLVEDRELEKRVRDLAQGSEEWLFVGSTDAWIERLTMGDRRSATSQN